MLIVNIVTIVVALIVIFVALHIAKVSCKVQFLIKCNADWTAAARKKSDLNAYQELRDFALDEIIALGPEFKDLVDKYREKSDSTDDASDVLKQIDKQFIAKIKDYQKYIEV